MSYRNVIVIEAHHDMISKALDICTESAHCSASYSPCLVSGPILRMTLKIFDVYGPILALDKLSCEKCMGDMMSRHILGIYVVGIHMYPKNDSCNGLLVHIGN